MIENLRHSLLAIIFALLQLLISCTNTGGFAPNIEPPNIEICVDLINGFTVRPYNIPSNTQSIQYRLIEQPNSPESRGTLNFTKPDKVEPLTVHIPWTDEKAIVEFCYIDEQGGTILCHTARVGDGLVLDEPVIIQRESEPNPSLCETNCNKEYEIDLPTEITLENIKAENTYRITVMDDLVLIFRTSDKGPVLLKRCNKATTLSERDLPNGIELSGGGNEFIIRAYNSENKLKLKLIDTNPKAEHIITGACLLN